MGFWGFLGFFSFHFLYFVSSSYLGLHFFSITKSFDQWKVLWFQCRDGRFRVFPPPIYRNPSKTTLFQWTRWRQKQSHDTNHKPPLLSTRAVENNNSTTQAKFSKLRCEHLFKPKLAKLPNWTNTSLHIVLRVHNLILHPESTYFLDSMARQQLGCMVSTQTCHHLPP